MPAPVELLQGIPLFADLGARDLERIADSFKERTFSPGDTIAAEGTGGVGFFVIESGTARVTVGGEERGTMGPGDTFGEIALVDDSHRRTATVTADTELKTYGLTSWEFRPLVEANSSIAWKLLETMAKRLRAAEQD